jgi:hypothetical protein
MSAARKLVVLWLVAIPVFASDAQLSAGLRISWDEIGEPVFVDGVEMTIRRATGSDVPKLAARIVAAWPQNPQPQPLQVPGWAARSQLTPRSSEVVQWRGNGAGAELLWSVALVAPARALPKPMAALPLRCDWTRQVSGAVQGQEYVQATAVCDDSAEQIRNAMRSELTRTGWKVMATGNEVVDLQRGRSQAKLVMLPTTSVLGKERSGLVWLQSTATHTGAL